MAQTILQPISGASFWSDLDPGIARGGGVGHFLDPEGDVHYAAMSISVRMEVVRRNTDTLFEDFVAHMDKFAHYKAVINGNMYGMTPAGLIDAFEGHDPVAPEHTKPEGHVVVDGKVVTGSDEPNRFHVRYTTGALINPEDSYSFGKGDPPSIGTAAGLGGLGPLIIKGLPYGERNEYRAGAPPGAPALGEPLPQFLPYLTQRSSAHFSNIKSQGRVIGKTILAVSRPNKKLLLLVQPQKTPGTSFEVLRKKLVDVGVDDAVFMDCGDSAMLMIGGRFIVHQGDDKNECCTIGLGFVEAPSPRTLTLFLLDKRRQHVPAGTPYRVSAGSEIRTGTVGDKGKIVEADLPLGTSCLVEWGRSSSGGEDPLPAAKDEFLRRWIAKDQPDHPFLQAAPRAAARDDLFLHGAEVFLNTDSGVVADETQEQIRLANLGYSRFASASENLRGFVADYRLGDVGVARSQEALRDYHRDGTEAPLEPPPGVDLPEGDRPPLPPEEKITL